MSATIDHRHEVREPISLLVDYEGADDLVADFTENLSAGGTFVATHRELGVGTRVKLVLSFPGLLEPIAIAGIVRWTRRHTEAGDAGAGIEFEAGPERERLAAAMHRIRARDPRLVTRAVRLLVVDDNPHMSDMLQQGLRGSTRRDLGGIAFAFRSAEDGRAALDILRAEPIDALIIDVYLPVVDGPKVIWLARSELGLGELPIVAFSGGGHAAREAAIGAGANIFLDKPMRLRRVLETLLRLLPSDERSP